MSLIAYRRNHLDGCRNNEDFFSSFFPLVESSFGQGFPALDVVEEKEKYMIKVDLPGIKKEDVRLSFENGILTIEGERKDETAQKDKEYHRIERTYGRFVRSLNLGTGVDSNKIEATYKDGVLEVIVAKSEVTKPKAIDIKVS